jgi:hypothetical protein
LIGTLCALEQRVKCLQEKDEDYTIEFQEFDEKTNQPFIMVVITPLMKRVHKLVCSLFFPVNSSSTHHVIIMHESIPGVIIPPPQGTLVGF